MEKSVWFNYTVNWGNLIQLHCQLRKPDSITLSIEETRFNYTVNWGNPNQLHCQLRKHDSITLSIEETRFNYTVNWENPIQLHCQLRKPDSITLSIEETRFNYTVNWGNPIQLQSIEETRFNYTVNWGNLIQLHCQLRKPDSITLPIEETWFNYTVNWGNLIQLHCQLRKSYFWDGILCPWVIGLEHLGQHQGLIFKVFFLSSHSCSCQSFNHHIRTSGAQDDNIPFRCQFTARNRCQKCLFRQFFLVRHHHTQGYSFHVPRCLNKPFHLYRDAYVTSKCTCCFIDGHFFYRCIYSLKSVFSLVSIK